MRVWPAHFTPARKGADLLALLAAAHDGNVRLSGATFGRQGALPNRLALVGLVHLDRLDEGRGHAVHVLDGFAQIVGGDAVDHFKTDAMR
jgi:hypothetical protein